MRFGTRRGTNAPVFLQAAFGTQYLKNERRAASFPADGALREAVIVEMRDKFTNYGVE